jgi:hypothetical protein
MREKVIEYAKEGAERPLAANILDPIRLKHAFRLWNDVGSIKST